jgi:hypothetical protein
MTTLERDRRHDEDTAPTNAFVRTGTFDALGHRFGVACDDPRTVALVDEAFGVLAVSGPPTGWYHLEHRADAIHVSWMGAMVGAVTTPADALILLRTHVQQRAISAADSDVVLRAGCAEIDGRTFVLSGDAGCGVSTLLAALVAAGGTYLSDDAIPVEVRSGRVRPFPQPLLLDDRSLDLLPEVVPLRSGLDTTGRRRLVALRHPGASVQSAPRAVSIVLFPERDDSGVAMLHPVDPDDAVVRLAEHAYNFPGHETEAIEALNWLMSEARSFELVGGDPHASAQAVLDAFAVAG